MANADKAGPIEVARAGSSDAQGKQYDQDVGKGTTEAAKLIEGLAKRAVIAIARARSALRSLDRPFVPMYFDNQLRRRCERLTMKMGLRETGYPKERERRQDNGNTAPKRRDLFCGTFACERHRKPTSISPKL